LPNCKNGIEVDAAKDLVKLCLNPDPTKRFQSMKEILEHSFLKENTWHRIYDQMIPMKTQESTKYAEKMTEMDDDKKVLKQMNHHSALSISATKIVSLVLCSTSHRDQLTCPNLVTLEKVRRKFRVPTRLNSTYNLFFLCAHSGEKVLAHPIEVVVKKEWVKKVAPLLRAASEATKVMFLPEPISVPEFSHLDAVTELVEKVLTGAGLDAGSDCSTEVSMNDREKHAIQMVRDGYTLVAQKAEECSDWSQSMQRVVCNGSIIWVKNEYADLYDGPDSNSESDNLERRRGMDDETVRVKTDLNATSEDDINLSMANLNI